MLRLSSEIGAYRDSHPRGNKFRADELRSRRDKVYELVKAGQIATNAGNQTNAAVLIQGPNAINISGPNAVVIEPNGISIVGPVVHNEGKR